MNEMLIKCLRAFEDGSSYPHDRAVGLCGAVSDWMRREREDFYLGSRTLVDTFEQMGLDKQYPVAGSGEFNDLLDLWMGVHGKTRRELAGCAADALEEKLTPARRARLEWLREATIRSFNSGGYRESR
jgi:hypothetical protein